MSPKRLPGEEYKLEKFRELCPKCLEFLESLNRKYTIPEILTSFNCAIGLYIDSLVKIIADEEEMEVP